MLLDGMNPEGIERCEHPFLRDFRKQCMWTADGETVVPSITMPCHLALFNGVSPQVHANHDNHIIPLPESVPSLVGHARRNGKKTAMVYSWDELRDLNRPGELDYCHYERMDEMGRDYQAMIAFEREFVGRAIEVIKTKTYDFIFYYYEMADIIGHKDGWGSEPYVESLSVGSECAEKVFRSLPEGYDFIITADHAGHYKSHNFEPEDRRIPIWFYGDRFPKGFEQKGIRLLDITPTAADIMGLPIPAIWEGVSRAK